MKILHVLGGYYPDPMAGTEVYVQSLATELNRFETENLIAAPAAQVHAYEHKGLRVHRYRMSPRVQDLTEIYGGTDQTSLQSFQVLLHHEKPDIVHFHTRTRTASLETLRSAKASGAKVIVTYHTPTMSCPRGTLLRWGSEICDGHIEAKQCSKCMLMAFGLTAGTSEILSRIPKTIGELLGVQALRGRVTTALRMHELMAFFQNTTQQFYDEADVIIALCEWARTVLSANGITDNKICLVRHGIVFNHDGEETPLLPEHPEPTIRLAFLGRIESIKGIHLIVDALEKLPNVPVQLDIFAIDLQVHSQYRSDLEQMARCDNRIRFLQPVTNEEVVPTLKQYDALVVPSQWLETGPLVILEAFAAGIPVIGSNLGGIAELVTDGVDGLLVAVENPNMWQHILNAITRDRSALIQLRDGVRPPRTMKTVAAEMLAIYASQLEKNSAQ